MPTPTTTDALLAAVEPIAAYVARTPAPNRHADRCAVLVDAVADYVEEVEAAETVRAAEPDWKALTYRMVAALDFPSPTHPLILRCRALLDSPRLQARAALPLAQRMLAATVTSHHLGTPDHLT
ncbi:hypothetical protein [Hymenobacter convexus]|uniref:hypothetical protein n=1 Tax=Hymenobacter sp. CA1UV-4 TaxID=3063782 RepID=UPI0027122AB0|nr:hypothetical protein [Hymenobacter sp. CA1UV-4]MDO7851379.1 hypothetical protein [Hymenobacter sp. CA1UV-4]